MLNQLGDYHELKDQKTGAPLFIAQIRLKNQYDEEGNFLNKVCILNSTPELRFRRDEPLEYWSDWQRRWITVYDDKVSLSLGVVNRSTHKLVEKQTAQFGEVWPKLIQIQAAK